MKTKSFAKRLTLKKETIARLNGTEMAAVNGGKVVTVSLMPTCVWICTETCSCILSVCDTCG